MLYTSVATAGHGPESFGQQQRGRDLDHIEHRTGRRRFRARSLARAPIPSHSKIGRSPNRRCAHRAVALNLLFGIPMLWGAAITVLDVFLLLGLQRFGIRRLEWVLGLVFVVGACLAVEVWLADPSWTDLAGGLKPTVDADRIYVAAWISYVRPALVPSL